MRSTVASLVFTHKSKSEDVRERKRKRLHRDNWNCVRRNCAHRHIMCLLVPCCINVLSISGKVRLLGMTSLRVLCAICAGRLLGPY